MKVLDSTFLVDFAHGCSAIESYLNDHEDEEFVMSTINIKELAVGAHLTDDPTLQGFLADFGWLTVIQFDEEHTFQAGRIEADIRRLGRIPARNRVTAR